MTNAYKILLIMNTIKNSELGKKAEIMCSNRLYKILLKKLAETILRTLKCS